MSNHDKEDGYLSKSDTVKYLLLFLVRIKKEQFGYNLVRHRNQMLETMS